FPAAHENGIPRVGREGDRLFAAEQRGTDDPRRTAFARAGENELSRSARPRTRHFSPRDARLMVCPSRFQKLRRVVLPATNQSRASWHLETLRTEVSREHSQRHAFRDRPRSLLECAVALALGQRTQILLPRLRRWRWR